VASALRRAKSSRVDPVALVISLTAGESGLSRRGMACLGRLRRSQLQVMQQSRGALVRVRASRRPMLDLAAAATESPLLADFVSLFSLQLIDDYPEQGKALRAILHARAELEFTRSAAAALWRPEGRHEIAALARKAKVNAPLLTGILWVALKPLCEAVARAYLRHVDAPAGGADCPVCGGPAWARRGKLARCALCESRWQADFEPGPWRTAEGLQARGAKVVYNAGTGSRLVQFDARLFETAFHIGPMIELVRLLEPRR